MSALTPLARLGPRRFRRHAWASGGRARIEVRRADGHESGTGPEVESALRGLRGVRWAQVNAVTGHVLVLFDQREVSMGALVETVAGVEEARGTDGDADGWSRAEPPHPDDPAALTAAVIALVADGAGLVAALASRLLVVPPVPTAARVLVGLVEAQPRLRRLVERGLGPSGTDAAVGIGSGILNGLTGGIGPQLATGLGHGLLLAEVTARRAVWRAREGELEDSAGASPQHPPVKSTRPTPFPPGPVEVFADRVAGVSAAAAGVLFAVTRDVGRTANMLLIGVPPAARLGRDAFAATLARSLAGRGVVPMDPGVFRRLDRVTHVLLDAALGLHDDPGVAAALDALADRAGVVVDVSGQLAPERVRRLQADGAAVLVVAGSDNDVLSAADVAVAVPLPDEPAGWAADLIAGHDRAPVVALLRSVPAARGVSIRSVAVASVGTLVAGVLTALVPVAVGDLTLQPVYLAGLVTQVDGIRAARAVTRDT